MPRNGNITGQVFDDKVIEQIENREKVLGQRTRNDKTLLYSNNQTAFLRLASSVNIESPQVITKEEPETGNNPSEEGVNQLKARGINETLTGDSLAKSCVLFGGVVGIKNQLNPKLKFGVYNSSDDPISTIAAYGWGGLGKKGYVPMPAIDNAKISFYNRGAIQKADVSIKVYSLEQLQIFDILYFRIGYTMLLEWGHNIWIDNDSTKSENISEFKLKNRTKFSTKPFELFFDKTTTQQKIFNAIDEQRKLDSCNYDAMLGKVTNFTWKFNDDGTYNINLKLIGMGDIIESLKINKSPIKTKGKGIIKPTKEVGDAKKGANNIEKKADADQEAAADKLQKKQEKLDNLVEEVNAKIEKIAKVYEAIGGFFSRDEKYFANNANWVNDGARSALRGYTGTLFINFSTDNESNQEAFQQIKKERQNLTNILANFKESEGENLNSNLKNLQTKIRRDVNKIENIENNGYAWAGRDGTSTLNGWKQRLGSLLSAIKKQGQRISKDQTKDLEKAKSALENQKSLSEKQKQRANIIRQQIEARKEQLKLSPETSKETANKSLFNQQLYQWRVEAQHGKAPKELYKLAFKANSANSDQTGVSTISLNFYYVRLGYMLKWIEENLLVYDNTKTDEKEGGKPRDPNSTETKPNPIFNIDYNVERNFCLRFPGQFSSDPKVCVIPSVYKSSNNVTDESKEIEWNILKDLEKNIPFTIKENDQIGRLMNIMVNIDQTASVLDKNIDKNGKVNLNKFLTSLLNEINDALGNVNKLEPTFNTEENTLTIIDANNVPAAERTFPDKENKKRQKMGVFNVYGIGNEASQKGSFVTNVDFQVQLPPNMAAMATISAQANGNIVGENATGLSKLNTGLVDRLITVKLDADSIEGAKSGKNDPTVIFNQTLETVEKEVEILYNKKKYAEDSVKSMRSKNRDIAMYLTGNPLYLKKAPAPFFIPFNLKLDMQGISGIRNYERFSITEDVLPYSYRSGDQGGVINFLVKGISHKIDNNEWTTSIDSLSVGAKPQE